MGDLLGIGIDIGSATAKVVGVDADGALCWHLIEPTEPKVEDQATRLLAAAREQAGDKARVVATGYGRKLTPGADRVVTEITCHARGVFTRLKQAGTLIDIGGQDSKVIVIGPKGKVINFAMNDKCAAGTGRFLEAMARALEVDIEELGKLDEGAKGNLVLSSMCTVFAESEVVSLIAEGERVREIVAGLHRAIASRTRALVRRVASDVGSLKVSMSGGVARNPGVVRALSAALGSEIRVPPEPDTVGALGAALIARERA